MHLFGIHSSFVQNLLKPPVSTFPSSCIDLCVIGYDKITFDIKDPLTDACIFFVQFHYVDKTGIRVTFACLIRKGPHTRDMQPRLYIYWNGAAILTMNSKMCSFCIIFDFYVVRWSKWRLLDFSHTRMPQCTAVNTTLTKMQ